MENKKNSPKATQKPEDKPVTLSNPKNDPMHGLNITKAKREMAIKDKKINSVLVRQNTGGTRKWE